jgi:hypothetical protein
MERSTYKHFLLLLTEPMALHNLEILQTRENLVLDLELDFHAVLGALLDGEWLRLKRLNRTRRAKINRDVRSTLDLLAVRRSSPTFGVCDLTSRPRERMMQVRGSLGSEITFPEPRPRLSFHLRRDSSLASAKAC